jgi:hypothetical protein
LVASLLFLQMLLPLLLFNKLLLLSKGLRNSKRHREQLNKRRHRGRPKKLLNKRRHRGQLKKLLNEQRHSKPHSKRRHREQLNKLLNNKPPSKPPEKLCREESLGDFQYPRQWQPHQRLHQHQHQHNPWHLCLAGFAPVYSLTLIVLRKAVLYRLLNKACLLMAGVLSLS